MTPGVSYPEPLITHAHVGAFIIVAYTVVSMVEATYLDDDERFETNSGHDCAFDFAHLDSPHMETAEPFEGICDCCAHDVFQRMADGKDVSEDELVDALREKPVVAYYFDDEFNSEHHLDLPEVGAAFPHYTLCIPCHRDEDYEHIFEDFEFEHVEDLIPGATAMATFDTFGLGKLISYYEDVEEADTYRGPNRSGSTWSVGRAGYTEWVEDMEAQHPYGEFEVFSHPLRVDMMDDMAKDEAAEAEMHPPIDEEKMRGGY